MPSLVGVRRGIGLGLLVFCAVLVAGCGSAGRGDLYSVRQVKSAFAAQGIVLHRNSEVSMRGVSWFSSRFTTGRYDEPGVMVVVISPSSKGHFFYQSAGRRAPLKKLGDVRAVVWDKALTKGVDDALAHLSNESAPSAPTPPTTTTSPSPQQLPTFAQVLAKLPEPLRAAVRKTATAPSAHVVLTGLMAGGGDFSTVRQIASLQSRFSGYRMDEIIVGTTVYRRSSIPGRSFKKWSGKWIKQDLSQSPAGIRTGWPGVGLLTFLQPLATLSGAGHLSTLGREKIRGVETTHYRDRIAFNVGTFPSMPTPSMADVVDVWVDSHDGLIRRASDCFAGMNVFTANLSRFGENVHVAIPSGRNVISPSTTAGKLKTILTNGISQLADSGSHCG